jgi:hypothetical protein
MPNYQGVWSLSEQYQNASGWPVPPLTGDIALFGLASNSTPLDAIQISTTGNSTTLRRGDRKLNPRDYFWW